MRDISLIEILADLLPDRVGSLLSINSLREDLEVSHKAVSHWLDVLERLYFTFRLPPFVTKKVRSIKKDRKLYLWDYSALTERSARIENLVASHLLKFCHFLEDTEGYRIDLRFLRDKEKREVDFLVLVDRKPWFAVEVKAGKRAYPRTFPISAIGFASPTSIKLCGTWTRATCETTSS